MTPVERNARRLIGILLQYFPVGGTSEDLRRRFERETSLVRQSFYDALRYSKKQGWIIGGGRGRLYNLSPNGSWKEESVTSVGEGIGVSRDKDQLEYLVNSQTRQIGELQDKVGRLLDWSNGGDAGVALPSLVRIVGDGAASTRQRLKAASAILAFQVQDGGVVEFTKRYLESVCTSTDIGNIDHKVEAAELLRRHEAPRVAPETVRPAYREAEPAEPPIPLLELVRQRRERQDRMEREAIEREMAFVAHTNLSPSRNGNGENESAGDC